MIDPVHKAVIRTLEYGSEPKTWKVDLDRSTVIPGSPGIYDGLVIAQWRDQ
jgi:hypothetical protein